MLRSAITSATADCPTWCQVDHGGGRVIHRSCTGEVLWRNGVVAVELAQYNGTSLIVMTNFTDDEAPSCANLSLKEAVCFRDALDATLNRIFPRFEKPGDHV